jgi:transcriptional regulator with XRE-family HTH domain
MSKVNLKDLAKQLNISVSSVSKALRDSHEIAEETKKKVRSLALELGYSPNPYAGFLRNQKSKTIALIAPELTNNFFVIELSISGEYCQSLASRSPEESVRMMLKYFFPLLSSIVLKILTKKMDSISSLPCKSEINSFVIVELVR